MRIAITGSIGSGKSEMGRVLKEWGYPVIDTDVLAHEALTKDTTVFKKIVNEYGEEAIGIDGDIDRKFLADKIFADPIEKNKVEKWIHPFVWKRMEEETKHFDKSQLVFVEVPLLFETGSQTRFDKTVLVLSSQKNALARLMHHRQITKTEAHRRWNMQMPPALKATFADDVIHNDADLETFHKNIENYINKLKNLK